MREKTLQIIKILIITSTLSILLTSCSDSSSDNSTRIDSSQAHNSTVIKESTVIQLNLSSVDDLKKLLEGRETEIKGKQNNDKFSEIEQKDITQKMTNLDKNYKKMYQLVQSIQQFIRHPSPQTHPIDTSFPKKTDNTPPFAIKIIKKKSLYKTI